MEYFILTTVEPDLYVLTKGGFYIGPRGGKWADAAHTIPWVGEKSKQTGSKLPSGKTPKEHAVIAMRVLSQHKELLPKTLVIMKSLAGAEAKVKGRVKTLESALGKLVLKPKRYPTADKLQDATGTRIVHDTVDQVKSTVAKLKGLYKVVDEDDYISKPQGSYRSHHLILEDPNTKLQFEVQVRTKNQDVFADWAHNVYKPVSETQAKYREHPEVQKYERTMAEYYWQKDNGKEPSFQPPCTPVIKNSFGCLS